MRKLYVMLILSVIIAFPLLSAIRPAQAWVTSHNWIGGLMKGETDDFLGSVTVAYRTGTTAKLIVNVYNHLSKTMNISAVYVNFDWGKTNYSSPEANMTATLIYRLAPGLSHVFTITFTVPDTTIASNLVLHNYWIYVEDVNAVGTKLNSNGYPSASGSGFAVLSDAQADSIETKRQIAVYQSMGYMFFTSKAREQALLASGTSNQAYNAYKRADFDGALALYQESLTLYQNAWGNETETMSGFEDAMHDLLVASTGAVGMIGWGYVIFGLGWVFIGIGVIIYAVRKPKTAPPP